MTSGEVTKRKKSEIETSLGLDSCTYSFSNKNAFIRDLKISITEKKKELEQISRDVHLLEKFISSLPE
ncbi:MAG: hypothetical protein WCF93_05435 [Candidatus Moraniibacteriota bacterium]